jgi:hypothetical protein
MVFPTSSGYVISNGLAALHIDGDADRGTYVEPNIWLQTPIACSIRGSTRDDKTLVPIATCRSVIAHQLTFGSATVSARAVRDMRPTSRCLIRVSTACWNTSAEAGRGTLGLKKQGRHALPYQPLRAHGRREGLVPA